MNSNVVLDILFVVSTEGEKLRAQIIVLRIVASLVNTSRGVSMGKCRLLVQTWYGDLFWTKERILHKARKRSTKLMI